MGLTVCSRIYGPNVRVSEKSNNYHKDIYGLYYCEDNKMFYTSAGEPYLNVFRMQDVDLSSLEIIGENYAKDKDHVYYQNKIFDGMDPTTFRADSFEFATDGTNLYFRTTLLEGMNPSSYKVLTGYNLRNTKMYVKDSNYIYKIYYNEISQIFTFDASSFETIGFDVMMDKDKIVYNNQITDVDRASVYVLNKNSSKDDPEYIICDKNWMYEKKYVIKDSTSQNSKVEEMLVPKYPSDGYKFEFIKGTKFIKCGRKIISENEKGEYVVYHAQSDTSKIEFVNEFHIRIDDEFQINHGDSIPIYPIKNQ